jgi:UDP-glucose-4-epimerase GalE
VPLSVPILETTPLHPVNPYGATKMICERLLAEHAAMYPLKWLALRYFNVAGCDPEGEIGESHDPETHVIPLLLDTAAGYRDTFAIFGDDYPTPDGTCIRDYIHVADLADAHVLAVADLLRGGESEAVNLGIGRGWSVRELVDVAGEVTGRPIPIQFQPRRAGDPPILVSNPERSKQRLGWQPQFVDVATHIDHAWTWRQRLRGKSFLSA